jgi:hypothetical protein
MDKDEADCIINITMNFGEGCTVILSGGEVDVAGDKSIKGARSVIEGARSLIEGATSNIQGAITEINGASVNTPSNDGLPPNYPRVEVLEE